VSRERDIDPEETAALSVLAELGRTPGSDDTRVIAGEDEVEDVLRRLDLEAVGLLAFALEPVAPRPETRDVLFARLAAEDTQEVAPVGEPGETASPARRPAPVPPPAPHPAPAAASFPAHSAAKRRRSFAPAVAALFALVAIGLGFAAAWLDSELRAERARASRLASDLARVEEERTSEIAALRAEVEELEQRRRFASGPAAVVFALRPPSGSPQPGARGKLWVAGDRRQWQLDVAGLTPPPEGKEYQVWFLVDERPLSGGCFKVREGRTGGMADSRIPSGVSAVAITLERVGGAPEPTSPRLLVAEEAVEL
jgi:hypothetical protein